jgi:hypothetical protein
MSAPERKQDWTLVGCPDFRQKEVGPTMPHSKNAPHPHMEWGRQTAFVNHFYFYLWDASGDRRS